MAECKLTCDARRRYLLSGLIKCGLCGLTYIGTAYPEYHKGVKVYYVCNGKYGTKGLYSIQGKRCPSKAISGEIEDKVWQDIESFLRNPGDVLEQLSSELRDESSLIERNQQDISRLKKALGSKDEERHTMLALFRKGRIDEAALDRQLEEITQEEAGLRRGLDELQGTSKRLAESAAHLQTVETLLCELNQQLDSPLTWELKRQLVEILVERIEVTTIESSDGKRQAHVVVCYRFAPPPRRTSSSPTPIGIGMGVLADIMGTL